MVNTCRIKRCGHYRKLNVYIWVGGAKNFTNSNVTCLNWHTKISKKSAWPHLVSITTLHIKLKLLFSFLFAGREMFANSLMSACVRSPRVSGWADRILICFGVWPIHSLLEYHQGMCQASPYILFLSGSMYSLTTEARCGRAFSSINTKSRPTAPT